MIDAVLFDKDGTLLDFDATWGVWATGFLRKLARDEDHALALGRHVGFDITKRIFAPDSPVIAGTPDTSVDLLLPHLDGWTRDALLAHANAAAQNAVPIAVPGMAESLTQLSQMGCALGVLTNDSQAAAVTHMTQLGVAAQFRVIYGFDSGGAPKPAPDMALKFANAVNVAPSRTAMVGDSTHDLHAARSAGMWAVGVVSGPALHADLAPFADVVLQDVTHLPAWIAGLNKDQT